MPQRTFPIPSVPGACQALKAAGCSCRAPMPAACDANGAPVSVMASWVRCTNASCDVKYHWPSYAAAEHALTPKTPATPRDAAPAEPVSYKTHFLIGLGRDGGSTILGRWEYAPPRKEVDARVAPIKESYLQFTVVSATGVWDAEEKSDPPLWTARTQP